MAMDVDYSYELISNETYAPQFIGHNKVFLSRQCKSLVIEQTLFFIFKSLCQGHQSPKHSRVKDYFIAPIMQCAIPRHAIAAKGKWQYIRRPTTADFFLQVDLPAGLVGKVAFISKPRLSS